MMWYWANGVHWWGWVIGFVGMVAFWALVIWAIWYVVAGVTRRPTDSRPDSHPDSQHRPDAKRILDERLARGEIDAEEYERVRDLITGQSSRPSGRPPAETVGPR